MFDNEKPEIQMKEFFGLLANKCKSVIKSISNIKPKELYNKTSSFYENLNVCESLES